MTATRGRRAIVGNRPVPAPAKGAADEPPVFALDQGRGPRGPGHDRRRPEARSRSTASRCPPWGFPRWRHVHPGHGRRVPGAEAELRRGGSNLGRRLRPSAWPGAAGPRRSRWGLCQAVLCVTQAKAPPRATPPGSGPANSRPRPSRHQRVLGRPRGGGSTSRTVTSPQKYRLRHDRPQRYKGVHGLRTSRAMAKIAGRPGRGQRLRQSRGLLPRPADHHRRRAAEPDDRRSPAPALRSSWPVVGGAALHRRPPRYRAIPMLTARSSSAAFRRAYPVQVAQLRRRHAGHPPSAPASRRAFAMAGPLRARPDMQMAQVYELLHHHRSAHPGRRGVRAERRRPNASSRDHGT